jgi:MoaA/NifB/PqqE/SkfB family radical SAM enzyme
VDTDNLKISHLYLTNNSHLIIQPYGYILFSAISNEYEILDFPTGDFLYNVVKGISVIDSLENVVDNPTQEEKIESINFLRGLASDGYLTCEKTEPNISGGKDSITPIVLDIEISRHCTNNCVYCFNESSTNNHGNIVNEESYQKAASRFLKNNKFLVANFTGGEPFLVDIFPYFYELVWGSCNVHIQTSGLGYEKHSRMLNEHKPSRVQVSLDSHNEQGNDLRRGKGSWKRAIKFIEFCNDNAIQVEVASVVDNDNLHNIIDTFQWLTNNYSVAKCTASPMTISGRSKKLIDRLLSAEQLNYLGNSLHDLSKHKFQVSDPLQNTLKGISHPCRALWGFWTIDYNGYLIPCPQINDDFGIFSESLKTNLHHPGATSTFCRNLLAFSMSGSVESCKKRDCDLFELCKTCYLFRLSKVTVDACSSYIS